MLRVDYFVVVGTGSWIRLLSLRNLQAWTVYPVVVNRVLNRWLLKEKKKFHINNINNGKPVTKGLEAAGEICAIPNTPIQTKATKNLLRGLHFSFAIVELALP